MNRILRALVVAPCVVLACLCAGLTVTCVVSGPLLFAPIMLAFALSMAVFAVVAWAALGEPS